MSGLGSGRRGGAVVFWAVLAALAALAVTALWVHRQAAVDSTPGINWVQVAIGALFFGWPWALAAVIVVVFGFRHSSGIDGADRLLGVATAGAVQVRTTVAATDWGAAMRAELAVIDVPRERWRFARGCAWASLRMGLRRTPVLVAVAIGVALGMLLLTSSRQAAVSSSNVAPLWGLLILVIPVLLVVGSVGAFVSRSARRGIDVAVLALVASFVGIVAVAVPEGARWAETYGEFLLDGDPTGARTASVGAADALTSTFTWGLMQWIPWVVLGPALGARLSRQRRLSTDVVTPSSSATSRSVPGVEARAYVERATAR